MFQMVFPNAFGNHGCILQHFEGFFKTPFLSTGHQSYSLDRSRIPRGQKFISHFPKHIVLCKDISG